MNSQLKSKIVTSLEGSDDERDDMVEELRELPDGTKTTSAQLLKSFGYEPDKLDHRDLYE